jgi:hypothetical protein
MPLSVKHFQQFVVQPTLQQLEISNKGFEQLIIGTALTESNLQYLRQFGNGPAKGLFQMEDATHDDIWNNFLKFRPPLAKKISRLLPEYFLSESSNKNQQIYGNLYYSTAMCAAHYLRFVKTMPQPNDLPAQAKLWKNFYNTKLGKGKEQDYISKTQIILSL